MNPPVPTPRDDTTRHNAGEHLHETWLQLRADPEISEAELFRRLWDEALDYASDLDCIGRL